MPIKCITFDLDDTLWECESVIMGAERRFYEWLLAGYPEIAAEYPLETLLAHRREFFERFTDMRHDFTILRKRWLAHIGEAWGHGDRLVEPGFRVFWEARNEVELFADVPMVLEGLSQRYRVGAITNGNADVHHIGIGHWFHFVVTAADAGALKPHADIFETALVLAGVRPGEIVHVGDDPVNDVKGAAEVGMRTVWVNTAGDPWPGGPVPDAEIKALGELDAVLTRWQSPEARLSPL